MAEWDGGCGVLAGEEPWDGKGAAKRGISERKRIESNDVVDRRLSLGLRGGDESYKLSVCEKLDSRNCNV